MTSGFYAISGDEDVNKRTYRVHEHTYSEWEIPTVIQEELEDFISKKIVELENKYHCDCDWCKEYGQYGKGNEYCSDNNGNIKGI